jgi:uncharacterized membrane protein (UPF0182 family)
MMSSSKISAFWSARSLKLVKAALTSASDHYTRALQALRAGDWTQFGAEMQKLGAALGQPGENH